MTDANAVSGKPQSKFDINTTFIPVGILIIIAPVIFLSIKSFYQVDESAQDIERINRSIVVLTSAVSDLRTNQAGQNAKLEIISELLREVRANQKKGN